jgi:hypothetical protein
VTEWEKLLNRRKIVLYEYFFLNVFEAKNFILPQPANRVVKDISYSLGRVDREINRAITMNVISSRLWERRDVRTRFSRMSVFIIC